MTQELKDFALRSSHRYLRAGSSHAIPCVRTPCMPTYWYHTVSQVVELPFLRGRCDTLNPNPSDSVVKCPRPPRPSPHLPLANHLMRIQSGMIEHRLTAKATPDMLPTLLVLDELIQSHELVLVREDLLVADTDCTDVLAVHALDVMKQLVPSLAHDLAAGTHHV